MNPIAFDDDPPEYNDDENDGGQPPSVPPYGEEEPDSEDGDSPFEEMHENASFENAQNYEPDFGDDRFDMDEM